MSGFCILHNAKGYKQRLNRCHTDINLTNQEYIHVVGVRTELFTTIGKAYGDGCVCVHPPPLHSSKAMASLLAKQEFKAG